MPTYHFELQVGRKCGGFQIPFNLCKERNYFFVVPFRGHATATKFSNNISKVMTVRFHPIYQRAKGNSSPLFYPPDSRGGNDCNLHLHLPALRPPFCLRPSLCTISITSPTVSTSHDFQHVSLALLTDLVHIGLCSEL